MSICKLRYSHVLAAFAAATVTLASAACSDSSQNAVAPVGASVSVNSGSNGQTGTAGQPLPQVISVEVLDQDGKPVPSVVVSWNIASGGGTVDSTTSTTDASGNASVQWTLGTKAGADSLLASIAVGATTMISATANAGNAAAVTLVSGDAQSIVSGSASQPLVVKVTDQFGNVVAGSVINWTVAGGGTLSGTSSTTDANGLAQIGLTTDASPAVYTVTATGAAGTPVSFTVTGT